MVSTGKDQVTGKKQNIASQEQHKQQEQPSPLQQAQQQQQQHDEDVLDRRYSSDFVRQLEEELSGSTERGIRIPMVRIPGKTHLSSVLLMSNPWAERDLDRRLDHIQREKNRRQKILDWNQRHFFLKQIFDADHRLRFTRKRPEFSRTAQAEPSYGNPVGRPAEAQNKAKDADADADGRRPDEESDEGDGGEETSISGQGIFAKPLEWNLPRYERRKQRRKELRKQQKLGRGNALTERTTFAGADKTSFLSRRRPEAEVAPAQERKRGRPQSVYGGNQLNGGELDVRLNSTLPVLCATFKTEIPSQEVTSSSPSSPDTRGPFLVRQLDRSVLSNVDEGSSPEQNGPLRQVPPLFKSSTLPQIGRTRHAVDGGAPSERHSAVSARDADTPPGDMICDASIIAKLTKTLPTSLMVSANRNINRVVARRKNRLLAECKRISSRDMFSDPRWHALKDVLVSVDENPVIN